MAQMEICYIESSYNAESKKNGLEGTESSRRIIIDLDQSFSSIREEVWSSIPSF
jgi:hypothetical protein